MDKSPSKSPTKSPTPAPKFEKSSLKMPVSKEVRTDSSDDEDDLVEEISVESKIKQLSPTKYFGKRTSFDNLTLKTIEKPMRRASALELNLPDGKTLEDKGYLVKFSTMSEEIKNEEKEDMKKAFKNEKPRRSILKNTFVEENLVLIKIFDKKNLIELIEKIDKACAGDQKLYNDMISKCFFEKAIQFNNCILELNGIERR